MSALKRAGAWMRAIVQRRRMEREMQEEMAEHLRMERDHFVDNLFHPNGREGLAAFLERRPGKFTGR